MEILSDKITKGIIFAGCSFTWGSGLWYYSKLPTIIKQNGQSFDTRKMNLAHIEYMKSVRFPRLVANHFNTFEIVNPNNGGSNETMLNWWKNYFINGSRVLGYTSIEGINPHIEYSEISYFVIQLTQWHRDNFTLNYDNQLFKKELFGWIGENEILNPILMKWLEENSQSLDDFINDEISKNLIKVKEFLQHLESFNIKVILFSWPPEWVDLIEKDVWLKDRHIEFNYKNNNYKCLDTLMNENKELMIKYDFENLENPPDDNHPSMKCHKLIAEHIINKINIYENKR
jgi:hypothetical protein